MIRSNSSHAGFISAFSRSIKGFTLIELLVVVIIIAVLAAVAVPQYKKAVLKSRFSTLLPLAKNLWDSNEVFYLSNGGYAAGVDELDVSAPADPNVQVTVADEEQHQYVRVSNPNIPNRVTMYQKHSPNFAGEAHCEALLNDDRANWLCRDSLQGTFVGNKYGYAVYSLDSNPNGILARMYQDTQGLTLTDGDQCISDITRGCKGAILSYGGRCIGKPRNYHNYQCEGVKANHGGICEGEGSASCGNATFKDQSICVGKSGWACYWSSFSDHSSCIGVTGGCLGTKFKDHSACFGNAGNTCSTGVQNEPAKFETNSSCVGNVSGTCQNADFKTGSICYANVSGACTGNTYDATSCCAGGANCTNEADRCETKNITVPPQPTLPDY